MSSRANLMPLLFLIACGGGQNTVKPAKTPPAANAAARYTAAQFFKTTSVRGRSFSHDETKILITSDKTGVFNVYS